jgi:hypothetical protein
VCSPDLDQLKYFCACTGRRSTGSKDRVLYSTYMELCNQLCPDDLFNLTAESQIEQGPTLLLATDIVNCSISTSHIYHA